MPSMLILLSIAGLMWMFSGCAGAPTVPAETPLPPLPSDTPLPPAATTTPTTSSNPTPTEVSTETLLPTTTPIVTPDRTATAQFKATSTAVSLLSSIGKELEAVELSTDSGYLLWARVSRCISISSNGSSGSTTHWLLSKLHLALCVSRILPGNQPVVWLPVD